MMSDRRFAPLPAPFGVEGHGLDVAKGVDADDLLALAQALVEHKLVLLRGQTPTPEAYRAFAASWGPPRVDGVAESNGAFRPCPSSNSICGFCTIPKHRHSLPEPCRASFGPPFSCARFLASFALICWLWRIECAPQSCDGEYYQL